MGRMREKISVPLASTLVQTCLCLIIVILLQIIVIIIIVIIIMIIIKTRGEVVRIGLNSI